MRLNLVPLATHSYSSLLIMYNDLANIECATNDELIPNSLFVAPDRRGIMCNAFFINYRNYEPLTVLNWSGMGNPSIFPYDINHEKKEHYQYVMNLWLKAVFSHPIEYMLYRFKFMSNILVSQWWWTPLDMNANNNIVQQKLTEMVVSERHDFSVINGILLIIGTIVALVYVFIRNKNKLAIVVLSSSILQLLSLYLALGVPAARFFLWNYLAIFLAIALAQKKDVSEHKSKSLKRIKKHKK